MIGSKFQALEAAFDPETQPKHVEWLYLSHFYMTEAASADMRLAWVKRCPIVELDDGDLRDLQQYTENLRHLLFMHQARTSAAYRDELGLQ